MEQRKRVTLGSTLSNILLKHGEEIGRALASAIHLETARVCRENVLEENVNWDSLAWTRAATVEIYGLVRQFKSCAAFFADSANTEFDITDLKIGPRLEPENDGRTGSSRANNRSERGDLKNQVDSEDC